MAESKEIAFKGITRAIFARAQYVAEDGYRFVRVLPNGWLTPDGDPGDPKKGPWLREKLPVWLPPEERPPSAKERQNPGLHRLFAAVSPTENGVRAFAKKWGQLGRKSGLVFAADQGYAESLAYWQKELEAMKRLIGLWELVRAADQEGLAPYVRFRTHSLPWGAEPRDVAIYLALRDGNLDPEGATVLAEQVELVCPTDRTQPPEPPELELYHGSARLFACEHEEHPFRAELFADWKEGDLAGPARYFLHDEVNRRLAGHVNPVVTFPDSQGIADFWFVPDTLLASLYVFFAQELAGQLLPLGECAACHRPFVPASAKQKYCSSVCRVRADAERRRQRMQG